MYLGIIESIMFPKISTLCPYYFLGLIILIQSVTMILSDEPPSPPATNSSGKGCDLSNYEKYFETGLGKQCNIEHKKESETTCKEKYICTAYHKCVCPEGLRGLRFEDTDIRICFIEAEGKCQEYDKSHLPFLKEDSCSWKSLDDQRKEALCSFEREEDSGKRRELETNLKKIVSMMKFHEYVQGKEDHDISCASGKCNDEGLCTDGIAKHLRLYRPGEAGANTSQSSASLIFVTLALIYLNIC